MSPVLNKIYDKMEEKYLNSDEEDETLSLCDLLIYADDDDSNHYKEDYQSSSLSDGQIDDFEFFNEGWNSTISYAVDDIIFCGKLIVNKDYRDNVVSNKPCKLVETTNQNNMIKILKPYDQKGKCMSNDGSPTLSNTHSFYSRSSNLEKYDDKNKMLDQRITIVKSPTRSRWFVFFFGSTRIPTEMEMREMRKRQHKKSTSKLSYGGHGKNKSATSRGIGWWKLIRALGCSKHHHADAMIKASYGCAPLIRE